MSNSDTHLSLARLLDAPRETEIGNHEDSLVVDEEVGSLHVTMKDPILRVHVSEMPRRGYKGKGPNGMEVSSPLEKLLGVLLDVRRLELDRLVLEEPCEVVVHVQEDHVRLAKLVLVAISLLVRDVDEGDDVLVLERLEDADLSQRRDWHLWSQFCQ
jgi:hypothetical protein